MFVFIWGGIHKSLLSVVKKQVASQFKFKFKHIDYALSINNHYLGQIYPTELDLKDTMASRTSTFYLNLLLFIKNVTISIFIS